MNYPNEARRHAYPSNADDVIDSRDVIAAAAELAGRWTAHANGQGDEPLDDAERHALDALSALASQGEDYTEDWQYGATLIRDSYFVEYAKDLAEDIGAIDPNAAWPLSCIDWDLAARELRMDYSAIDFDGVTYWVR